MHEDKRTAQRYFLLNPLPAGIAGLNADVIDLSVKGARLQLTRSLPPGSTFEFLLPIEGATLAVPARVLWCDLSALSLDDDESDRYQCGIEFEKIPAVLRHFIADLVAAQTAVPIEESRHSLRYRVTANLAAKMATLQPCRVLDISITGARVGTATLLQPGLQAPLRFTLDGHEMPVDVSATVVWSRAAERVGRYQAGLRIIGGEEWLRAVIEELSLRGGAVLELNTLQRKFDPLMTHQTSGLLGLLR